MTSQSEPRQHIYLVDGSSYIFRAFYAIPKMNRSDGTPTNAVFGYSSMLFKLLQDLSENEQPTHVAVIFDAARKTFRNDFYPDYKAHRPPAPDELVPQFALIREATEAFNVPAIEMDQYEADDLIATYAVQARDQGFQVTIVSSDKDLMQLVGGNISLFDTMKNKRIGVDEVVEKFGVGPDKVVEVQALAGDSADNVPGVPGIGIKTAAQLIQEFGDLETLLARAEEIPQPARREKLIENAELARISLKLCTLKQDVPLAVGLDGLRRSHVDANQLMAFADKMEFRALKAKIVSHMGSQLKPSDDVSEPAPVVVKEREYETVQDMSALEGWIEKIKKVGVVAVDTETTSLNAMSASLVGISLSVEPGKACYIPLRHGSGQEGSLNFEGDAPKQIPVKEALAKLKPLLESPAVLKVGQNIKYDALIFKQEGINIDPIDDTMLISYVLEVGLHGHGLDELSELYLGEKPIAFKEVAGTGKNQLTFDAIPLDKATEYAAEDADLTGRLYSLLKPRLAKEDLLTVYETLERPLVPVLVKMEQNGVKVDRSILARLSNEFAERLIDLEKEIHKLAGQSFNIASPKQLGEILFDELKLPGGKLSKNGAYVTNVDVMEKLAADGHALPAEVLKWRQLAKLKSTYTDALQQCINKQTGRVHTSFSMAATTTGRLASSDPNIQNIPIRTEEGRKIRKAFVAEHGHKLVAADYSQIELRLLAEIADLDSLKKAFREGLDIHAMTASEIFGVPIEGMDPMVRRKAKAINFGIIYGISAFGLARQLDISRGEAADYIALYFERFPGIQAYMERTKEQCHKDGFVETIFGRRCHINMINDKNPMRRAFGERAAINAPIQGSAADIIRRAMVRMPNALENGGFGHVKMLLQVHDELIFEVPEADVEGVTPLIRDVMENAAKPALALSIPLTVDVGVGDNWDEAH